MSRTFEDNLKRLEEIVRSLEAGDVMLDESIKLFEEGVGLTKKLQNDIEKAEGKIKILTSEQSEEFKDFEVKDSE